MDVRIRWIQRRVYAGLGLKDDVIFKELLERDDRRNEQFLNELLNGPANNVDLFSSALIFYSVVSEVVREIEVEEGNKINI